MIGKKLRTITSQLLMFCMLKNEKKEYILLMFQNATRTVQTNLFFKWSQIEKDGIILQSKNYQHY